MTHDISRPLKFNLKSELSRRDFTKGVLLTSGVMLTYPYSAIANTQNTHQPSRILNNPKGFHGMYKDPVTGFYFSGDGTRVYAPQLMRMLSPDGFNYVPFGSGNINGYAAFDGNPVDKLDPNGTFPVMPFILFLGGFIGGAAISAASEGIITSIRGGGFDWKQVVIGAGLGAITGGFSIASQGASTSVQVGLALGQSLGSGIIDFGINLGLGYTPEDAGIYAGIGALIGLSGSSLGPTLDVSRSTARRLGAIRAYGLSGRGAPKAAKQMAVSARMTGGNVRKNMYRNPHNSSILHGSQSTLTSTQPSVISPKLASIGTQHIDNAAKKSKAVRFSKRLTRTRNIEIVPGERGRKIHNPHDKADRYWTYQGDSHMIQVQSYYNKAFNSRTLYPMKYSFAASGHRVRADPAEAVLKANQVWFGP